MVSTVDDLKALVFTNIPENFKILKWFCKRAILAPRNDAVGKINLDLLQLLNRQQESFSSIDTVIDQEQVVQFQTEFLTPCNKLE